MKRITKAGALRRLLNSKEVILAPCAFDAVSARCIELAGFPMVGTTGFGIHGSFLGVPDNGLLTFPEMLSVCGHIANAVEIPVMADAEGGYGNAVNTYRTVQEFEQAGIAGLFIEDQRLPPNCPFFKATSGEISVAEMCGKIQAAVEARQDKDFVICARTEAHWDEAVERVNAYADAGADLVKIIPRSREELEYYPSRVKAPLHLGFAPGKGINDGLTAWDAGRMGYKIVTFPMTALFLSVKAMQDGLRQLKSEGTDDGLLSQMTGFPDYFQVVRGSFYRQLEHRLLEEPNKSERSEE